MRLKDSHGAKENYIAGLKRGLAALNTHLASCTFLVGDVVTMADFIITCNLFMGFKLLMPRSFTSDSMSLPMSRVLLGDEDSSSLEIKRSCMEWCLEHNIEYIEACASNPLFDKCLSVDGDSQGVERLLGALSAYMWPGMVLKSGDTIKQPSLPEQEGNTFYDGWLTNGGKLLVRI